MTAKRFQPTVVPKGAQKPKLDRSPHLPKESPFAKERWANLETVHKNTFLHCLGLAMATIR